MAFSVKQEEPLGCGIACVAFIKKVNYKKAKKYFGNTGDSYTAGYTCKDVVKALSRAEIDYSYRYIKGVIRYKDNSIVFIKRSKRYPKGHYLVKAGRGWMDPWINFNVNNSSVSTARSGFRKRLPGRPIYLIFHVEKTK